MKLDKQFPVEQFEATVSQSTVPSPPLSIRIASQSPAALQKRSSGGTRASCWGFLLQRSVSPLLLYDDDDDDDDADADADADDDT